MDRKALTRAVLDDPAAIAVVVLALCRRQQAGKFSGEKWLAIRSGIVSLADLLRAEGESSQGQTPTQVDPHQRNE